MKIGIDLNARTITLTAKSNNGATTSTDMSVDEAMLLSAALKMNVELLNQSVKEADVKRFHSTIGK